MDQGLTAVLGAGVGVLGSLRTAALTWTAVRSQQRTELLRQTRATRRETYGGLLNSVRAARGSLAAALDGPPAGEQDLGWAWAHQAAVESATAAVQLEGPPEVAAPADTLAEALFTVFKAAYPWRVGGALSAAEQAFLSAPHGQPDLGR